MRCAIQIGNWFFAIRSRGRYSGWRGGVRFHFTSAGSSWIGGREVGGARVGGGGGGGGRTGGVVGAESRHCRGLLAVVGRVGGLLLRGWGVGVVVSAMRSSDEVSGLAG